MKHLKAGAMPGGSETFIAANESHTDLRGCVPLKKVAGGTAVPGANLCNGNAGYTAYWQVFSDRHAFSPNLSVLDLLMCEGPSSKDYLLAL